MTKSHQPVMRMDKAHEVCCLLYTNEAGEVPCCCDCEVLDTVCDRCCRCQGVDTAEVDRVLNAIQDRCRFPSCSGHGAVQVRLDVLVPLIVVPVGLLLSALGCYLMYFMLSVFVLTLLGYYRIWKRRLKRTKSRFFYSWSLTSCLTLYYVFQLVITVYREVLFWENLLFSSMFAVMMYCLYLTRCDPGVVQTIITEHNDRRQIGSQQGLKLLAAKAPSIPDRGSPYNWQQNQSDQNGPTGLPKTVNFTSLRMESDMSEVWCDACQSEVPAWSTHCFVCDVCILERDHHCIWVDNCIGINNHRSFFIGLMLMMLTGLYGSQLMLTTVCTPEMYYDWFLVPADCTLVYSSVLSGLGYVSAMYTLCSITCLFFVFVYQVALISQNITSRQLHEARRAGQVRFGFYVTNNENSHGLYKNWRLFLIGRHRRKSHLINT